MSGPVGQVSAVVSGSYASEVSTLVSSAHAREARALAVDIGAHGAAALLDLLRREVGTAEEEAMGR